jgi:uncharacterized membrane protein
MNCPFCAAKLTALVTACPHCAKKFDPQIRQQLSIYFALHEEKQALNNFINDISLQAADLSRRLLEIATQLAANTFTVENSVVASETPASDQEFLFQEAEQSSSSNRETSKAIPPATPQNIRLPAEPANQATRTDSQTAQTINAQAKTINPPPRATIPTPPQEPPRQTPPKPEPPKSPATQLPFTTPKPTHSPLSELLIGQRWLLILGIVAVIAGVGYFLKYSIDRGWVNPVLRVISCYAFGIAFMAVGERLRRRDYEKYGLYLTALGIVLFYFSTYAGYDLYHLFGQIPAYIVMILSTVLAVALAIRYDNQGMAILGVVAGFAVPFILGSAHNDASIRLPYIIMLSLGFTLVCTRQGWLSLRSLGIALAYFVLYHCVFLHPQANFTLLPVYTANILFLIFLIVPFYYEYKKDENTNIDVISWILNPVCSLTISYFLLKKEYSDSVLSIVPLCYTFIFAFMATMLARRGRQQTNRFVVLTASAAVYLALVPLFLFSFHWLTIIWALQALAVVWIGLRLGNPHFVGGGFIFLAVTYVRYLLWDYPHLSQMVSSAEATHALGERLLTQAVLLGALPTAMIILRRFGRRMFPPDTFAQLILSISIVFTFLFWLTLTNECRLFFADSLPAIRHAAMSALWTLYGAGMLGAGFRVNAKLLRLAALVLLGLTWAKVFLVDTADLSTPYRILILMLLGLILIASSFLYHKFKNKVTGVNDHNDQKTS